MLKRERYLDLLPGLSMLMARLSNALASQGTSGRNKNVFLVVLFAIFFLPAILASFLDISEHYTSSLTFLGWPLLAVGDMPRGWLSIGTAPVGLIAMGAFPVGVFALGGLSFGLVSIGGGVIALVAAIGGMAVAPYTLAGLSMGLYARAGNGCALGYFLADGRQFEKLF